MINRHRTASPPRRPLPALFFLLITLVLGMAGGACSSSPAPAVSLSSLALSTQSPTLAKGTLGQLTAVGTYSDGSTRDLTSSVTWASRSPAVATVATTVGHEGQVTAMATGQAIISASSGGITASVTLNVSDATLRALWITPPLAVLPLTTAQIFTVWGHFSDGTTQHLTASATWTSSSTEVALVSGTPATATALSLGSTTLTATVLSHSATALVNVTSATLTALAISPSSATVATGTAQQFTATGTFSDGTTRDLTSAVTWTASSASFGNLAGSYGLATGGAPGVATTVTATLGNASAQAALTVTSATITGITVTPPVGNIAKGNNQSFLATATLSDGTSQDVTSTAMWNSAEPAATILSAGTAYGFTPGIAVITAMVTVQSSSVPVSFSGSATLTVGAPILTGITVAPAPPASATLAPGATVAFVATGVYSDTSSADISSLVYWVPANTAVITVSNDLGQHGLVTAVATGQSSLTAYFGEQSGIIQVTVNGPSQMWFTSMTSNANLGGISGADMACLSTAPLGVKAAKALLSDGVNRIACTTPNCIVGGVSEHKDWVFSPNTQYFRTDETTVIGTTNSAGIFSFPLTNLLTTTIFAYWSGLSSDWTSSTLNCSGWTTSDSASRGEIGGSTYSNEPFIDYGWDYCSEMTLLVCVEQPIAPIGPGPTGPSGPSEP